MDGTTTGLSPKVTHTGTHGSALKQDTVPDFPAHPPANISQKTTSTATSSPVTARAESRLPLPFPFKTRGFSPPELRLRFLCLLSPQCYVCQGAGEDALSPWQSYEPRVSANIPGPGADPTCL